MGMFIKKGRAKIVMPQKEDYPTVFVAKKKKMIIYGLVAESEVTQPINLRLAAVPKALFLPDQQSCNRGVMCFIMAVFLLMFCGCAMMNSFIFIPKKEFTATPAKKSLPFQEIWFPARDGVPLNGWFIPGAPETPLVLFFHGNAGNLSDNLDYLSLLHSQGYPIFIFDYRGYGKSQGEPFLENDLYQDARGALSYLERQGWRHERIIFFGQSLGSAVAVQLAMEAPPAGLVLEGSFTSIEEIVKYTAPLAYYTVGWWGIDLPFNNIEKIGMIDVPLLLIHGDRDTVVPVEMTRQLFTQAVAPKMIHIIKGGGHIDVFTVDSSAYLRAWSSYLRSLPIKTAAHKNPRHY